MREFSLDASSDFSHAEVIALYQSGGWSNYMLEAIQSRYSHVRQTVLITDNQPGQRAFYEALGFTEGLDFSPEPLRMFAKFG